MHFSLLSADLILLILEAADPESLLQFCRASKWIHYIVMDTKTLRYQVELAMSGMKDGPPSQYRAPVRLEQLLNYKKSWPALSWSKEDTLVVSRPTIIGVSGGFFYHASERSGQHYQWVLEIYELRSFRIGRTTSTLRHYKFNVTFDIQSVVIDPSQNLLVLVELDQPYNTNPVSARLHCRDLRTCDIHPRAPVQVYTLYNHLRPVSRSGQQISVQQTEVCGSRIAISVRSIDGYEGSTEIFVVDWHLNRMKRWSAGMLSFQFLDQMHILIAAQSLEITYTPTGYRPGVDHRHAAPCSSKGPLTPRLLLCDISNFTDASIPCIRVFKFPETWTDISSIDIIPNLSPSSESRTAPGTLFYPDPTRRIFVISIEFDLNAIMFNQSSRVMIILEASFLRPAVRNEPTVLPWLQWEQQCIVHSMSDDAYCFKVVGRRLIHLQSVENAKIPASRLYTIEFSPRAAARLQGGPASHLSGAPSAMCSGRGTTLTRSRVAPRVRSNSMDVFNITMFDATEDSILLFDESIDSTLVRILTFGKAAKRQSYNEEIHTLEVV